MALLDVEAVVGVVAAVAVGVERGRRRRERGLSKISGGCHVGDERVQHFSLFTIHD